MTQYAYYVQTKFDGDVFQGQGLSEINYFTTQIDNLTQVLRFSTINKTTSSITLQWDVIEKEVEYIQLYSIDIIKQPDEKVVLHRNYCLDPPQLQNTKFKSKINGDGLEVKREECCCEEYDFAKMNSDSIDDAFVNRYRRRRREKTDTTYKNYVNSTSFLPSQAPENVYEIVGLEPYTLYTFQMFACINIDFCSAYAMHSQRTKANKNSKFLL